MLKSVKILFFSKIILIKRSLTKYNFIREINIKLWVKIVIRLEAFCNEKNLSQSTTALYTSCVKLYEEINNLSLDDLIEEADQEEEQGVRWKNRKLKKRLIHYRNYLFANKSQGTANRYLGCIKTIYRHFEIEILPLPSFNSRQIDKTYQMDYDDLVTKQQLIDAYYEANNVTKCILVFAISTGLSKVDMLNLKVIDFINACNVQDDDLPNQLQQIKDTPNLIPCFKGARKKTGVKYTTFCSPEAVEHILQYLLGRDASIREVYRKNNDENLPKQLEYNDKLFDISNSHLLYTFAKINRKLNLGKVGKFSRLRCHMLRKYHASTLSNCQEVTWTFEEIDTLQGRLQDMTHRAYFHDSTEKLYEKYCACVDELMLFKSIHGIDEEAFERLKKENNFYKKEIVKNETKLEEQQKAINELVNNQKELKMILGL